MLDPYAFPKPAIKAPRVCGAPLCGKPLALLNKRELCFTCQNRALMSQSLVSGAGTSAYRTGRR